MLEVNITKKMPGFDLNASLSCEDGKLLVVTGPSGAGKTTLIRILAGLETADDGYIRYNNQVWFDSSQKVLLPPQKRKIGYVFQEHTLFPHLSITKNIGFACTDRQQIQKFLRIFRLDHIADNMPYQVSGGERQRAAFAQALAKGPDVLLLDEPFSALDMNTRNRLQHELKRLKELFCLPIIHVTHDLSEADFLGDSIYTINREFGRQHVMTDEKFCFNKCLLNNSIS